MEAAVAINYDAWITWNTALCHRLSARITETACENNRSKSTGEYGDLRCAGCGGLHNQLEQKIPQLQLITSPVSADDGTELDPFTVALMSILDKKVEGTEAETGASDEDPDYSEAWIDDEDLDNEVLQLFPELREFIEERDQKLIATENEDQLSKTSAVTRHNQKKYAVYIGRCKRCNGAMANDIEWHEGVKDDDIYRCFTCGWRTSPAYAWNRNNLMSGRLFK